MNDARAQIELILRQSGISAGASEDVIKGALVNAGYRDNDIAMALYILKETPNPNVSKLHGLHKVIRSDAILTPAEISVLLGIDVPVKDPIVIAQKNHQLTLIEIVIVVVFSFLVAGLVLLFFMYLHQMGPFHVS